MALLIGLLLIGEPAMEQISEVTFEERGIRSINGKTILIRTASPSAEGPHPTIIGVAGGTNAFVFKRWDALSRNLLGKGVSLVDFAPQGRQGSQGVEDCNGHVHQDDLKAIIDHLVLLDSVDESRIAIASFSYGITTTFGALTRHPELPVLFVVDWEGPACPGRDFLRAHRNGEAWAKSILDANKDGVVTEREVASFRAPWVCNVALNDEEYWRERDAARYAADVAVPYLRYQAAIDHVQGASKYHMMELVNAATNGSSPWTRVNKNPPNTIYRNEALARFQFHTSETDGKLTVDETCEILSSYILEMFNEQPWKRRQKL